MCGGGGLLEDEERLWKEEVFWTSIGLLLVAGSMVYESTAAAFHH